MYKKNMKRKLIGIIVCTLLIAATVLPVAGNVNNNESIIDIIDQDQIEHESQPDTTSRDDEWPMFQHDLENTGYSSIAIAPQTNNIKWIFTANNEIHSSPAIVDGKVYISVFDNHFYCLDADTGEKLWDYFDYGFAGCPPTVAYGNVYVASTYDWLYCFDADTGSVVWKFYKGYRFSHPAPAVADGMVYFAHSRSGNPGSGESAVLYRLDAYSGYKYWEYDFGYLCVTCPAVYNGKVYIGSEEKNEKMYCFDADTGTILWDFPTIDSCTAPTIFNDKLYFGGGLFYCLDPDTGSLLWDFDTGSRVHSSPAVAYGNVYLISSDKVYCLNADTGDFVWSHTPGGYMLFSSPAVADGKIYASMGETGKLICLDAYNGEPIWHYKVSPTGHLFSSPAVAYGRIYVGGALSRKVYCFEDPSRPPEPPIIDGPTEGFTNCDIEFSVKASDPEGDSIKYYVEWDDGSTTETDPYPSGEWATVSHAWNESGTYSIRVKAEDTYGIKSHWSEFHNITITEGALLEIQAVEGGLFKVKTVIKNLGVVDATNVDWSITLDGGLILLGKETTDSILNIPAGGEEAISSSLIVGLGKTTITVIAGCAESSDTKEQEALVLLFFILVK